MNAKADANNIAGLHAKFNKLTEKVGSQSPGGFVRKCWTFGGDHVQADSPRKNAVVTTSRKCIPPGYGENRTKMVEGVSYTYCGQCLLYTKGPKGNITTTHICREFLLENPRGDNPPADPTEAPAPPDRALAQDVPADTAAGGVNPKSSMASDFGVDT